MRDDRYRFYKSCLFFWGCLVFPSVISTQLLAAQSCPVKIPGCPQYAPAIETAVATGTKITITYYPPSTLPEAELNTITAALNQAIANVNAQSVANGSGNTFQLTSSASDFSIGFDLYGDTGPCARVTNPVACTTQNSVSGVTYSATTIVYLGTTGGSCSGACFNYAESPSQFQTALTGTISHEFQHLLGASDSIGPGVNMSPFDGTNNVNGTNKPTPCDSKNIVANRATRKSGKICSNN